MQPHSSGMRALWLEQRELSYRTNIALPTPPRGEALVRLRLGGICATDLEMVQGYYPFTGIPGHEFVGEIAAAAEAPQRVGERVVGEINAVCGVCEACRTGRPTHCQQRTVLGISQRNGVFAEYLSLPLENLHPVPEGVPDEAAVFTEPLAAALEIQEQIPVPPDARVLLVGAGRLGQLVARTLALTGCELSVVVRNSHQKTLLEACGIRTIRPEDTPDGRMDIVVEATGSPAGFELARRAVRPRGTLVLKSTYAGSLTANFSALVVDEITLVGSRCGPFAPALRLLAAGMVDPTPLIMGRYPLSQGERAFEESSRPGVLKILLEREG